MINSQLCILNYDKKYFELNTPKGKVDKMKKKPARRPKKIQHAQNANVLRNGGNNTKEHQYSVEQTARVESTQTISRVAKNMLPEAQNTNVLLNGGNSTK
ncbi:hypothetical protein F8M41_004899 [Gigaspora margarita]|uniref:Uncharacterized protein n=1 Tax=Gigaspora margarita TaxID=4874 RepID=A0A8H3X9S1_GIGMA|nr:hypothetical protein F8M41_004899 [Gigaspora margarita]